MMTSQKRGTTPISGKTLWVKRPFSASSKPIRIAQPHLSRVRARSSPATGYKFGCVCSYMAGHLPRILMTGHIGTKTPKFVPPRWGRPRFDLLKRGCANSGGFGACWESRVEITAEGEWRFSAAFLHSRSVFSRIGVVPAHQLILFFSAYEVGKLRSFPA